LLLLLLDGVLDDADSKNVVVVVVERTIRRFEMRILLHTMIVSSDSTMCGKF
jgi:hypothetical protein